MNATRQQLQKDVMSIGEDIVLSERFEKAWRVPHHHKRGTIAQHSLDTAGYALRISRWLSRRG
jgi:hypothetical protein